MKKISVILPVYNIEKYVEQAVRSVLGQTYENLEILIVNDGSTDSGARLCQQFDDARITIIHQQNKGLSEARNTGIRHATGDYIAFLDGDDIWQPTKLARHVQHLEGAPTVGLSFSRSAFIDENSQPLNIFQMPRLKGITPDYALRCNPVGNGSAGVFRREAFDAIAFTGAEGDTSYFDRDFAISEDIECFLRILIQTPWIIEGIPEPLTLYRITTGSLSSDLGKRIHYWEKLFEKVSTYAPDLIAASGNKAMAYRLKALARECIRRQNPALARQFIQQAIALYPRMIAEDARSTITVMSAAYLFSLLPSGAYGRLEKKIKAIAGKAQQKKISKESLG